jgi:hypothetical protein
MANEGYFTITLKATKSGATVSQSVSKRFSMTGAAMLQGTQSIGTTAELVDFADISGAPQAVLIQNLDATNYIEVGGDSGLTVFKLKIPAGFAQIVTLSSATLYAKANTASVNVMVTAIEI